MIDFLKKICLDFAPAGHEKGIYGDIEAYLHGAADKISLDSVGNIIAHKKGNGKKILLCAHTDSAGLIVTYIEDDGKIRFKKIGKTPDMMYPYTKVIFKNGTMGFVVCADDFDSSKPDTDKMYIDIGCTKKEDTQKFVNISDTAVFEGETYAQNGSIFSPVLDNRAGCAALCEMIKKYNGDCDIYALFSSMANIGHKGAAAYTGGKSDFDFAIVIDATPENEKIGVKTGCGAVIRIMEEDCIADAGLAAAMGECAEKNDIKYTLEARSDTVSDAAAIHRAGSGIKTVCVSYACAHMGSICEKAAEADIESLAELICRFAEEN